MEEWRDIKGYEGIYQVSDMGRVRSLDRIVPREKGGAMKWKGRMLSLGLSKSSYYIVSLWKDGKGKSYNVHQLVMESFTSHVVNGWDLVIDHIDNDPTNNNLSNLQLITHGENVSKGWNKNKKIG